MSANNSIISNLTIARDTLKAKLSLHEFLKQAWHVIEGSVPFVDGWHIGAISEHLEALANREIKRLLINIPPRHCKSTLVSIAFPVWRWLWNPGERFMYASYSLDLSREHSTKCRRLINSPWFQERFGDIFALLPDQNTKGRFDNNKNGYRIATSVGAAATGYGGSILVADDPNNVKDGESVKAREKTIEWLTQVWETRLNNPKEDCMMFIQQRAHQMDVSGYIFENYESCVNLVLPAEYEDNRKAKTISLPSTKGKIWTDPREKEGELLWPERVGEKEIAHAKKILGEYGYCGQYQQRPSPKSGGIIKKAWFKWWKDSSPPEIIHVLQSWDTAFSTLKSAAYSACTTWGVFYDENNIANVILLSSWKGRLAYPELRVMAKRLYYDYRDIGKIRNSALSGKNVDMCLIEAKASGDPLIRDLEIAGIRAMPVQVPSLGKEQRVNLVSHLIEAGRVWLPSKAPAYSKLLPYADEFLEAAGAFPNLESNDLVDTMSQALMYLKDGRFLAHPHDPFYLDEGNYKKIERIY